MVTYEMIMSALDCTISAIGDSSAIFKASSLPFFFFFFNPCHAE